MKIQNRYKERLADQYTPVGLYNKIRLSYPASVLLESSEYHSREGNFSFIGFDPISTIQILNKQLIVNETVKDDFEIVSEMQKFIEEIELEYLDQIHDFNGVFGFSGYDAIEYFENIKLQNIDLSPDVPILRYDLYRFIIVFDHFSDRLYLIENTPFGEDSQFAILIDLLHSPNAQIGKFGILDAETASISELEHLDMIRLAKKHCHRGDVFQIVMGRRFRQKYTGDEFQVYRALRTINPSPYLFYFSYQHYKFLGSSPEPQIIVSEGKAEIHPIAGTFRRTLDWNLDQELAQKLLNDPKESAEHVMLVDLARNDLSRNCKEVQVVRFKEVQFYSHVIHLVSKVIGKVKEGITGFQIFADTFPAGTLSGAPKYRAMQLIDQYETSKRGFYGGAIGIIKLNGDINHAILIRTFMAYGGELHYQAGGGLVIHSEDTNEIQEVHNKLGALKSAILKAANL